MTIRSTAANLPRRTLATILAAGMVVCLATSALAGPNPRGEFQTAAPYAILIDAESGTVLFEKNADQLLPPASLAKLMTAEVVFNEIARGRLKLRGRIRRQRERLAQRRRAVARLEPCSRRSTAG